MPIKIPDDLPAYATLQSENIFVMTEERAIHQDIRSLKILILNLMPKKIVTETQLLRLLGNCALQVDIELLHFSSYEAKNTSSEHFSKFYSTFEEIKDKKFDGMVITGAPVEHLEFAEVDYWEELKKIMEWSSHHVFSTLHICWGAQAALYYHFGVNKYPLPEKLFGIFPHRSCRKNIKLLRGFDDIFHVPHSRYTEIRGDDIKDIADLEVLSVSSEAGVYIAARKDGRQIFVTGHPEYDALTLKEEYERDKKEGLDTGLPENYFPDNDPGRQPVVNWQAHANLLFANWLNYYVYQETPYDLNKIH